MQTQSADGHAQCVWREHADHPELGYSASQGFKPEASLEPGQRGHKPAKGSSSL